jgi:hypothetical protein
MHIPNEWYEDYSNMVLTCAACNRFCNRYSPSAEIAAPDTLGDFYQILDLIFVERTIKIKARRKAERRFFSHKPWESEQA